MSTPVETTTSAGIDPAAAVVCCDALLPSGDDVVVDEALDKQRASLAKIADSVRRVQHFNAESTRLIPGLATALVNHAKDLAVLQRRVAVLGARSKNCRSRCLALAAKHGIDVSLLQLHDPDAVPDAPR